MCQSTRLKFLLLISFVVAVEVESTQRCASTFQCCFNPPIESILNVNVWDGLTPSTQAEYDRLKAATEKFSDSTAYKAMSAVAGAVSEEIPGIDKLVEMGKWLVENSINIVDDVIPRIVEMEVVKNKYSEYKATLQVMRNNLNRLRQTDFKSDSRIAMTHDIQNDFEKILLSLGDRDGVREYDRFSAPIVLPLAQLAAIFEPINKNLNPALARSSRIACQLKDILHEYRSYVIYDKLRTDVSSYIHLDADPPFCVRGVTAMARLNVPIKPFELTVLGDNDFPELSKFVRMKIEQTFQPYIDKTSQLCSASPSNQFRTGQGKLTLIVNSYVTYKLADGSWCDNSYSKTSITHHCDTYFEIYIDGTKVHRTTTLWNYQERVVFYKFTSKKIRKDSVIRIKVMDEDGDWLHGGADDLITEWTTNIDQLLIDGYHNFDRPMSSIEYVDISAFWEDEINVI